MERPICENSGCSNKATLRYGKNVKYRKLCSGCLKKKYNQSTLPRHREVLGLGWGSGIWVHHINMNHKDNTVENLYKFSSPSEHKRCHDSLNSQVEKLIKKGVLKFKDGRYFS